jgi:hypothetical protein
MLTHISYQGSPRSLTYATSVSFAARHTLAAHQSPSVPVDTPASPHRQRQDCVHGRAMDSTSRMGKGPGGGQRAAQDSV